jgi:hypothetical protein
MLLLLLHATLSPKMLMRVERLTARNGVVNPVLQTTPTLISNFVINSNY